MGTSQNGKIERITNKIISKRLDASLAQKLRKTAKNARDSEFLAILTGEPQILAVSWQKRKYQPTYCDIIK